jgi:hypothetical protein
VFQLKSSQAEGSTEYNTGKSSTGQKGHITGTKKSETEREAKTFTMNP